MSRKRNRKRSSRPKWVKGDRTHPKIGKGTEQPMNFSHRAARKPRAKG